MKRRFGVRVGLSDHSMGHIVATTAVALGAEMVEKHFILDRRLGGPDSAFSMEPEEFKVMIESIRNVEKSIGKVDYALSERTLKNRDFAKSLFVVADVKEGDVLTEDNVKAIRPFNGILPKYLKDVLGKKFVKPVERGTPLSFDLLK